MQKVILLPRLKNTFALIAAVAGLSSNAFAKGIQCIADARPVDGMYREVRLQETSKGFDVFYKTISPGFGSPVETKEVALATNLKCNQDGLVAYCGKVEQVNGVGQLSNVTFKIVETTELMDFSQKKAEKTPPQIHVNVISPLVKVATKYTFPVSSNFSKCKEL